MTNIEIGDRVSWTHKPRYGADKKPRAMTGTVTTIHRSRQPWAGVASGGDGRWGGVWVVPLVQLTRAIAQAVAAPAWAAPGDLRRAVDDYDEAMALANAGSIGAGVDW